MEVFVGRDVGDALVDVGGLLTFVHHSLLRGDANGVPVFLYELRRHTVDGADQGMVEPCRLVVLPDFVEFRLGFLPEFVGSLHGEGGQDHLLWFHMFRVILLS